MSDSADGAGAARALAARPRATAAVFMVADEWVVAWMRCSRIRSNKCGGWASNGAMG